MIFGWSLQRDIPSFDFCQAVTLMKSRGATEVLFMWGDELHSIKHGEQESWNRVKNLVIPLAELAGLKWSIKRDFAPRIGLRYQYGDIEKHYRKTGKIWKWPRLAFPFSGYVTVTLRNWKNEMAIEDSGLQRNSSDDWKQIIEDIRKERPVVVMRDDMTIEERLRLYGNAYMNLGVNTGPMALTHFSDAPYLTFKVGCEPVTLKVMEAADFGMGSQLSFRNERQMLVWEQDTHQNVMKYYRQFER